MSFAVSPDGRLDRTHQWQNENDRVEYMRAFWQGPDADRRMQLATWAADPETPNDAIRALLVNPRIGPRTGYDREEPTIGQVLSVQSPESHSLFDYSGTPAGQESTSRPSLGAW